MRVPHRFEAAPYLLVAVDFLIAATVAIVSLPFGPLQIAGPVLVLLALYASGEYSLLSEIRVRSRVGVIVACTLLLLMLLPSFLAVSPRWLVPMATGGRIGVTVGCCVAVAVVHGALGRYLQARSRRYVLHLRADMEQAGLSLARHLERSGYPGSVVLDADPASPAGNLPVDILDPRRNGSSPGTGRRVSLDPARFCDVALRVLPPAVLAQRADYVRWDAAGRRLYDPVKRAFDMAAAFVLLVLASPLFLFAALGILLRDGRPVLFRQVRVGRFGARFSLLKFRTLRAPVTLSPNPNEDIEERVFPFGALLRRSRLDELPQLINILRGDMSLVGPRPEMEYFHTRWSTVIPFYKQRLLVRPGLSGWAQVRFPHTSSEPDYWDKTAYDLWYVARRNPVLDVRICLRTIGVMFFGSGAR